jgi:Ca2+-binding RTX toxin-like protein
VGRARRLTGGLIVGLTVAVLAAGAGPAGASGNHVLGSRATVVTRAITVQDLAPPECDGMGLTALRTRASNNGAIIQGTNGNDLILGTAGDDRIQGRNGDDCLVGGAGADDLDGGGGWDVCITGGDAGDTTRRCEA